MTRLLIGNTYNEHIVGDLDAFDARDRRAAGNIALRMAWLLEAGDVLVLPQAPDPGFIEYVLALKGLARDTVAIVVPLPGRYGNDVLTGERLLDHRFVDHLRSLGSELTQILPYSFDSTVARLARELGLEAGTPAFGFLEAGGTDLLNSKSVFRAIAAGVGVPMAEGFTTMSRAGAEEFVGRILGRGDAVIVKQDVHTGGFGNDILAPCEGVEPVGAPRTVVLTSPEAIAVHLDGHWPEYTSGDRNPVVIEHYIPGSIALGAEVSVTDDAIHVHHVGEMRMAPIFDGIAIPGVVATRRQQGEYVDAMVALCEPIQGMGYRGFINIDGLLTPDGEVLLSEFNGRLGGTTHLHWIGQNFLGPHYADNRLLVTRNHWRVPSSQAAVERLAASGLAFDPGTGLGVIVTADHVSQCGAVEYCAVAEDVETASAMEHRLSGLFA
ncbi:peptide ligase PGM1-related protein [Streptomyces sp. NPDC004126]|uniref:preATP grasp domain-containing protein n=1 Tax=Streptomyces sp. NPDC004126 TaxID=3390695 RepID=UPI003CFD3A5D